MIKNQKQASLAKDKLGELKKAKEELLDSKENQESAKFRLGIKAFDGLIKDLEGQLNIYESLIEGNIHCLKAESLEEISKVLISARLAQKMSQKELAEILDMKEQQIQRYEATNYETASWPRIIEISLALKIKFHFEKIVIINVQPDCFNYPGEITKKEAEAAEQKVKIRNSLICA